ncbi:MAG: polymerase [Pseudomonadota bacterium]|jgi:DNA polymerase-1
MLNLKKCVLVDGSSYLFRAFHALPDLRTATGEPTGAIRGVVSMLKQLLQKEQPDYFAVIFDAPGKNFRDDIYPEYKATRSATPSDLVAQIAPLYELIRAHGWPLLVESGVEADDVIGTLAKECERAGVTCLISTGDKDMAQLVTPLVSLVNTMSNETLDEAGVLAKFGVKPSQIIDYLALVGDTVDNVPGVPKVGPKTAVKWLSEHEHLDNIIARADTFSGAVGENLRQTLHWLPTGRKLVTIDCGLTLPLALQQLVVANTAPETLKSLYERFEFKTWLKELSGERTLPDKTKAASVVVGGRVFGKLSADEQGDSATNSAHANDSTRYRSIVTEVDFARLLQKLHASPLTCFDTETTSLDSMSAKIVGLAFAWPGGSHNEAVYVPLAHRYAGAPEQLSLTKVLADLSPWFASAAHKKCGQHSKYDEHVLANHGLTLRGLVEDSLLQSYVLESHKPHDMDSLALRHLNTITIKYEQVAGKGASAIPFEQVDVARATAYSAEDADITLRLVQHFAPQLTAEPGLDSVYRTLELPSREVLFRMERHGVLIDPAHLHHLSSVFGARILELEQEAYALAGQPFNLGSPKQLGEILFTKLGLPVQKKTATGQPSTDEEVLTTLADNYPLPKLLLEHRGLAKLKSTYTDKLPLMINSDTGRVHTNYAQATAVTGRLASNDPNLQNIPVRSGEGKRIREAFIAPAGSVLVSADYSQIELRIMAHLSQDESLLAAFAAGHDIHKATAADIFGVAIDEVSAEQRRYTKAVNFGLIYGMSAFGLANQLGVERSAAQTFIDRYFNKYPGVLTYMNRTREEARSKGYVETVFGRRLWLTDIVGGSGPRRQAAERAAINAPMQGTAADLIKLAMIAVDHYLSTQTLTTKLIMQVHDELVLEVPEAELATIKNELPGLMQNVAQLSVPLLVEVGVGKNWQEAH